MNKTLKILLILFISAAIVLLGLFAGYFLMTSDVRLSPEKLVDYGNSVTVYDENGDEITSAALSNKRKSVKLDDLSDDTVHAFIASEDRNFYRHRGLNYKRMIKALYKNVTSASFKEGASTISQQLIKNTHLSNDKTIKRKLTEIRLTKQLEKRYSKDEILEMYLNTIYFGHNCYGLQSAANFYFGVPAGELTLEQSATLVGLLTSPNNYSPFKNPEKSLKRRNLVLKSMLDCGYIDKAAYEQAASCALSAVRSNRKDGASDYISAMFDELDGLDVDFYDLSGGYRIFTYMNAEMQQKIEELPFSCDRSVVLTSDTGGVQAYVSSIDGARRQPGSTIKPLLVYAPALEEKKIHTFTKIRDEKVDFNGYSPENHDKKYHGEVTVVESLINSYNVPAVKTLNNLTVSKAEKYANAMQISLDDEEKNLSLALGGMKYGMTLKHLCDSYATFANGGNFAPSRFIKEIQNAEGKTVYADKRNPVRVFSEGTASLVNGMLTQTKESGTAKRLKNFSYDLAVKTGTCGNAAGNTDAYSLCYTSQHTLGVWLGDKNNVRQNVTGGRDCCEYAREILERLYRDAPPQPLDKESGTAEISLDKEEYNKNAKILIADGNSPLLNRMKVRCLSTNVPTETSTRFTVPAIKKPSISVSNNQICIELCQTEYYLYDVYRSENDKKYRIYSGAWKEKIIDEPNEGRYVYTVIPYYTNGKDFFYGEEITLPQVKVAAKNSPLQEPKIPDIVYKEWDKL